MVVDKPTRGEPLLDLVLTNAPNHFDNIEIECALEI